jgi:hypothetical protein
MCEQPVNSVTAITLKDHKMTDVDFVKSFLDNSVWTILVFVSITHFISGDGRGIISRVVLRGVYKDPSQLVMKYK